MNDAVCASLEHHFDTAFAAPDGIKKLRELILTLAMQGKLVAQDPHDSPASQLVKEIEAEKKRLVKEGKIKAPKPLPEIKPEDVPYALPQGWEWVRFPDCYYGIGNRTNQIQTNGYLESGAYPVVDQGKAFIAAYTNEKELLLKLEKPVIVFGDHTKNIKYVDFDFVIGADGVKTLCPYDGVAPRFLFRLMQSYSLTDRGYARHYGVLNEKLAPLPPLPEQHRIVAKIDQLMARCDELEKLRNEREQMRHSVHAAAIKQLLEESSSPSFASSRLRVSNFFNHFGELYTVKENVTELRTAILQLAVMGKLVPQNPNDPPASQLLKNIEAEKKRLVKEGKIRSTRSREDAKKVKIEDVPYLLPQGWEWARLGDISLSSDSGWSPQCLSEARAENEWGVLKVSAVSWGNFNPDENKALPPGKDPKPECEVMPGDLLLSRANTDELVARSVIVGKTPPKLMMSDKIVRFTLSEYVSKLFVNVVNGSLFARAYYVSNASGTSSSMKNVTREVMSNLPVPLPPLPEQHRIVAKIDSLMALCDTLEQQIDASIRKQTALLDAVMAQV